MLTFCNISFYKVLSTPENMPQLWSLEIARVRNVQLHPNLHLPSCLIYYWEAGRTKLENTSIFTNFCGTDLPIRNFTFFSYFFSCFVGRTLLMEPTKALYWIYFIPLFIDILRQSVSSEKIAVGENARTKHREWSQHFYYFGLHTTSSNLANKSVTPSFPNTVYFVSSLHTIIFSSFSSPLFLLFKIN